MQRIFWGYANVILFFVIVFLGGCVQAGPSGKWIRNSGDAQLFESKTLLKDHIYYYRGNETSPDSIIAIDNKYTLKTKVWSRVEITQKILDDWMYWLTIQPSIMCPYYGGAIITPDGEKAGIWYSKKRITRVKMPEPGILQVYPPYNLSGSSCAWEERLDDL
jgi:hypothetical protein